MSLAPGLRLGPYEIIALAGCGGSGEVYRARDLRLGRIVALKFLETDREPGFQDDARLRQEARAIATLTHSRVCALHDISEYDGRTFLVMEFIEGETLAERLVRGRLPVAEALEYAVQTLEALDHAHDRQVVHGDLKPSNVMITSGGIKLLDFGLAKLRASATRFDGSPLTTTASAAGRFEGTVPYMSPEQLEAGVVDERSDIFAFGATFFEMLTGRRAFENDTPAGTIAAILERQPVWPATGHAQIPQELELLVMTCLSKNPDRRWQAARDLELQLRNVQRRPAQREPIPAGRSGKGRVAIVASAIAFVTGSAAWYALSGAAGPPPRRQFLIEPPPQSAFASGAISPDGRQLAFFRVDVHDTNELWTRPLDSLDARRVEGTRGARWQFWSPDGKAIGFFAGGRLKTIPASGGAPDDLAPAAAAFGASWGPDGSIIYAPAAEGGLYRIASTGGQSSQLTTPLPGEVSHRWPHFLPDGQRFLFLSWHREPGRRALFVGFLNGQPPRRLASIDSAAAFAPPHYILWTSNGTLVGRRFDLERLEFTGSTQVVATSVNHGTNFGWSAVTASADGAVVYQSASPSTTQLTWFSRAGQRIAAAADEGSYGDISLGPDQTRLALTMQSPGGPSGVWQLDLQRGVLSQFAADAPATAPVWSPDGETILYARNDQGAFRLFRKPSSGGTEEPLFASKTSRTPSGGKQIPSDWSADGRFVLFEEDGDIWMLPVANGTEPRVLVRGPAYEGQGRLSRDQKWIAFSSDSSGRREIYVALLSNPERRWQMSSQGGRDPVWRTDGSELFYVADDGTLMAVALRLGNGTLEAATPVPLFKPRVDPLSTRTFVTHDGQRFLVNQLVQSPVNRTAIVFNWSRQ